MPDSRPVVAQIRPGDYVAIMEYAHQTPELDAAVDELRRAMMTRYRVATTMGYGPQLPALDRTASQGRAAFGAVPAARR